MRKTKAPIPTLEDLPRHGVKAIRVWCGAWPHRCTHQGVIPLERVDLRQTILQLAARLRCEECGARGGTAMPAWPNGSDAGRVHTLGYPTRG